MADRIHPYPMFPQSLTPNSLQQSQVPQQPQQLQQPDPQMISALSNTEHSRMWQMNQLQNAYRPQQSGDLAASQMNHQMQEFARGQALSHPQGQPMVQQIQQSFGLNAQRMNHVFHNPQAGQSQPLMQPNFPNVPMNNQQQMKAPFNMNPMMHGLNNSGVSRPLNIPNQQEMARLEQQLSIQAQQSIQAQRQPNPQSSVDMFASASVQHSQDQIHGSPHPSAQAVGPPGPNQGMGPGNPQQNQKRMITPLELQDRKTYLLRSIAQAESEISSLLQNARNAGSDPATQQRINGLRAELHNRKDLYAKFVTTFGSMLAQQLANGIPSSNMSHMNSMPRSNSQQTPQTTVANGQAQPNFVTQSNQPVPGPYNIPANVPSPLTTQGQGTLNQQIPIQPTHTPIGLPNAIPARNTGTPHQMPSAQLPNVMSPNLGNLAAQGGQKVTNQTRQTVAIMPLDKQRFDSTYAHFCRSQNLNPGQDLRVPIGENRFVGLHQLHVYVMHEGGARSVTLRDMWPVIGGRLGITQFPGNDSEPARCGPGMAQQLQNTYEQYLQHFENAYVLTVKNRAAAVSSQHPINANPLAMDNNPTAGMSGNSEMPPNPPRLNPQVIAAAARHAHTSVQDMRAQRVQEPMIAFVERHRPELQKVYQQQAQFLAKRHAEQEQNLTNVQNQLANMHDPPTVGPQVQRPIGGNPTVNMAPGDSRMVNGSFMQEGVATPPHKQAPTQEQLQQAMVAIGYFKQLFQQRLPEMPVLQIQDDQRPEYHQLLEQVFKMTSELDPRLHLYFIAFKSEEFLRKYVAIVLMVARQRQLLRPPSPQYIIKLDTLRTMQLQILKLNEEFENRWRAMKASSNPARVNPIASLTVPPAQNTPQITPAAQTTGRQVSINPPPPPQPQPSPSQSQIQPPPPQSQLQPNQSQHHSQQPTPPMKKPFRSSIPPSPSIQPASATVTSPTPPPAVASSSTPATSAPTPQTTAASPQTPKSPPSKAVTKTKTAARANRKPSTAGRGPATPEMAPSIAGVKRPSEEEVATLTSVAPSEAGVSNAPSPKKAKTEWEGETSEALVKKQQEVENIKTDEDATAYFVKELMALTASSDEGIHPDIASTLSQILAGMPQEPVDATTLSVHGLGDAGPPPTALSPHLGPSNDAFLMEFVDFSSFTTLEDDDDSKAPTPDLVPSSETNLSPESGSEGDSLGGSPDKNKNEESGDPLRLGSLKEIDGGESAYYQIGDWKWEGTMPTLDQPWAIFPS